MKFYSKEEIATIKSVLINGEKLPAASRRLSKEFNRSEGSVYLKLLEVGKEIGVIKHKSMKKPAKVITQSSDKGVTLRNGFVFDFKPQRAEMHQDHVRLYF
jgi:hypothetical protein